MYPLCRHLKSDGKYCQSPALTGQLRCFHHREVKTRLRRRTSSSDFTIPLVYPEDRAAVQLNLHLIAQALTYGRMDTKTAHALTHTYRACLTNLKLGPLSQPGTENTVERIILTPDGDEITPPREQLEEDEDPPVHGETCPCRKCAEEFRNAAPEQHHADCGCGLCQPGAPLTSDVLLSEAHSAEPKACPEPAEEPAQAPARSLPKGDLRFPTQLPYPETTRTAPAQKLYDQEPAKIHVEDEDPDESPCKKIIREYHARQDAIAAGRIERPAPKPVDPNAPALECIRRYNEKMAEIERNKQIGEEIWQRRFAHIDQPTQPNTQIKEPPSPIPNAIDHPSGPQH